MSVNPKSKDKCVCGDSSVISTNELRALSVIAMCLDHDMEMRLYHLAGARCYAEGR